MYPQPKFGKRALAAAAGAVLVAVSGCGGGGGGGAVQEQDTAVVKADGYEFRAPADWSATVAGRNAIAKQDAVTLVAVTVLPTVKSYNPKLFARLVGELDRVTGTLAGRLEGRVTARRTTVVAGRRVRQYQIAHADLVDRLTFVFEGKTEYLLTCRWRKADGEPSACATLTSSFTLR